MASKNTRVRTACKIQILKFVLKQCKRNLATTRSYARCYCVSALCSALIEGRLAYMRKWMQWTYFFAQNKPEYSLFSEIEGSSYFVSVIEGFFFNRDQTCVCNWRMSVKSVRNRVVLITDLKKVTDRGFFWSVTADYPLYRGAL